MSIDSELDNIIDGLNIEKVKNKEALANLDRGESFWDILNLAKEHLSEEHHKEIYFDLYMLDETGYNDVYRYGRAMFLEMLADEAYDKGEI